MKNNVNILIMLCLSLLGLHYGCERTDLQKLSTNDTEKITQRGACSECPGSDECCGLLVITAGSGNHEFSICGTTDGDAVSCESDPTDCSVPVDGWQHSSFTLNLSGQTSHVFCIGENTGIVITHISQGSVTLTLTFQHGQTTPQSINISFNGQERKEYEANSDCTVSACI